MIGRVNGQFNRMRTPGARRSALLECIRRIRMSREFTQFFYGNLGRVEEGERDPAERQNTTVYTRSWCDNTLGGVLLLSCAHSVREKLSCGTFRQVHVCPRLLMSHYCRVIIDHSLANVILVVAMFHRIEQVASPVVPRDRSLQTTVVTNCCENAVLQHAACVC